MANFGWAYVNCEDTSSGNANIYGPTGSILFLTGSQAASGSTQLVYYTASAATEHPYAASTLVLTGTLIVTGAISASNYHIEDIAIIDATGSTYFGDDQADKHRQLLGDLEEIRLQHLVDHDHERRDDGELHDDPDVGRNLMTQQADEQVGEQQHENHRCTHHERRSHLSGHRQRRADTEHLQGDGVVVEQRINERVS